MHKEFLEKHGWKEVQPGIYQPINDTSFNIPPLGIKFRWIDFNGAIPGGEGIEFLRVGERTDGFSPFLLVMYSVFGVEQPLGLRIDGDKRCFLDHISPETQDAIVTAALDPIIDFVYKYNKSNGNFSAVVRERSYLEYLQYNEKIKGPMCVRFFGTDEERAAETIRLEKAHEAGEIQLMEYPEYKPVERVARSFADKWQEFWRKITKRDQ